MPVTFLVIYTFILNIRSTYYITERLAKNKWWTIHTGWTIHKFIITSDRYNMYQISNRYLINLEMNVNYPSLLNLVQSVIIINAKYVA